MAQPPQAEEYRTWLLRVNSGTGAKALFQQPTTKSKRQPFSLLLKLFTEILLLRAVVEGQ